MSYLRNQAEENVKKYIDCRRNLAAMTGGDNNINYDMYMGINCLISAQGEKSFFLDVHKNTT